MQHFIIKEDALDLAKSPSLGLWLNKMNKKKEALKESNHSAYTAAARMPEPARQGQLEKALTQLDDLAEHFQQLLFHQNPQLADLVLGKFKEIKTHVEGALGGGHHHASHF